MLIVMKLHVKLDAPAVPQAIDNTGTQSSIPSDQQATDLLQQVATGVSSEQGDHFDLLKVMIRCLNIIHIYR